LVETQGHYGFMSLYLNQRKNTLLALTNASAHDIPMIPQMSISWFLYWKAKCIEIESRQN